MMGAWRTARLVALPVLAVLLLAACQPDPAPREVAAPTEPEEGEVAFRLIGPNEAALVVPVHVNGEGPYDFVFDTGATLTCLDRQLMEELGLQAEPGVMGRGVGVGGAGRVAVARLDSLRIGAAHAAGLTACVLDLSQLEAVGAPVQGLVGLNFMRAFRVELDFARSVLVLTDPG
jgi:predicted aspartyl protease